jgi:hypothetical protein
MLTVLSFARVRALARAVSSAFWEVVHKRRRHASMMGRIRHGGISSSSLSIMNEGAAINEPSVVSLRKGALLNVVWAEEELFKDLGAGVN